MLFVLLISMLFWHCYSVLIWEFPLNLKGIFFSPGPGFLDFMCGDFSILMRVLYIVLYVGAHVRSVTGWCVFGNPGKQNLNGCILFEYRRINMSHSISKEDIIQLYHIDKPVCHSCRVNSKDSPNCFCGLVPPPNGVRKHGLWRKVADALQDLGPDPGDALRLSQESPSGLTNLGATCYVNSVLQCLYMNRYAFQLLKLLWIGLSVCFSVCCAHWLFSISYHVSASWHHGLGLLLLWLVFSLFGRVWFCHLPVFWHGIGSETSTTVLFCDL